MSTAIMAQVWPLKMPQAAKAVLISLADNANDHGYCWPSIPTICDRTCLGRTAVIEAIKWLETNGALVVKRSTRVNHYIITAGEYREQSASRTVRLPDQSVSRTDHDGATSPPPGLHQSASRTSVVRQTDPNRKEPSRTTKQEPPAGDASLKTKKPKAQQQTFVEWAESMGDAELVPADDPIFGWAEKAGVPADWLELAWLAFDDRYTDSTKRYGDWRAVFRNAVKGDWLKVWGVRDGRAYLTTAGEQWQQFRDRRAA